MTEQQLWVCPCGSGEVFGLFGGPGGDLLSHALRRSTIGAEGFHGRVRDGIGCFTPRHSHQAIQSRSAIASSLHRFILRFVCSFADLFSSSLDRY